MKYILALAAGVWIGLAFNRIPHFPIFRDQPKTPVDWAGPKMVGSWTDEDQAVVNRYFNGGAQ